ncbi:hypothetical protein J4233_02855 [Candidatus Pacearchaeota archaeon]|nr:hypothetical protein [Candidatus Pacearchaeota archaeon]
MEHKLSVMRVANSLAVTTALAYLVCIIAVWLAPGITTTIGNYLLHGVNVNRLVEARTFIFSLTSLILGTILSWLAGALFAAVYNKFR